MYVGGRWYCGSSYESRKGLDKSEYSEDYREDVESFVVTYSHEK